MASQWLKARQTKYATYATVYILVILAILVGVNLLAKRYNKTVDATAGKRFSLSPQTAKIVKGLKHDATILYFNQSTHFRDGRDLLDEYANLSPKVKVRYVDPDKDPQLARENNIRDLGAAVVEIDGKKQTARSFDEQGITGAFIRDLKGSTRTICFVTGGGEHQLSSSDRDGLSHFQTLLSGESYQTKSINLVETDAIPSDCTAIVIAGPTSNYEQPEVSAISGYVENGGRALFMLDPPLDVGRDVIAPNKALATALAGWGVTLQNNLILDLNPIGQLVGLGPQVTLVTSYSDQPIVSQMSGTATGFPLARSMTIADTANTSVQKLFSSSNRSLATTQLHSASINPNDPSNKKGPFTIAVAGTYNTNKKNSQGRFVVVGSSTWATNRFIGFNGNSDLALNAINWLSSDEDLISIRPKKPEDQRITMTRTQLDWVRVTSQFALPIIMLIIGVGVWWKRR